MPKSKVHRFFAVLALFNEMGCKSYFDAKISEIAVGCLSPACALTVFRKSLGLSLVGATLAVALLLTFALPPPALRYPYLSWFLFSHRGHPRGVPLRHTDLAQPFFVYFNLDNACVGDPPTIPKFR